MEVKRRAERSAAEVANLLLARRAAKSRDATRMIRFGVKERLFRQIPFAFLHHHVHSSRPLVVSQSFNRLISPYDVPLFYLSTLSDGSTW